LACFNDFFCDELICFLSAGNSTNCTFLAKAGAKIGKKLIGERGGEKK
jgi:hypothetical protein